MGDNDPTAQAERGFWGQVGRKDGRGPQSPGGREIHSSNQAWDSSLLTQTFGSPPQDPKAISPTLHFPLEDSMILMLWTGFSTALRARTPGYRAAVLEEQAAKDLGRPCQGPGHRRIALNWSEDALLQSCVLSWRSRSGLRFCLNSGNQRRAK